MAKSKKSKAKTSPDTLFYDKNQETGLLGVFKRKNHPVTGLGLKPELVEEFESLEELLKTYPELDSDNED